MAMPSYQNHWSAIVGSHRGVPDVAFDADPMTGVPVYDSTQDGGQVGGVKLGAQVFQHRCGRQ